eukprot:2528890-Amphidinium_carterae.1
MKLNEVLKEAGIITWVDEEILVSPARIDREIADGINRSRTVLICLTKKYHDKVIYGPASDYCRQEFECAKRSDNRLVVCVMESEMKNIRQWNGTVGMALGGILCIDLSDDDWSDNQNEGGGGCHIQRGQQSPAHRSCS